MDVCLVTRGHVISACRHRETAFVAAFLPDGAPSRTLTVCARSTSRPFVIWNSSTAHAKLEFMSVERTNVLDGLEVSADKARLDVDLIHRLLTTHGYWAAGRTREAVERSIQHSLCFGAYRDGQQLGFGRVITDFVTIGYVADMIVVPEYRGSGIGQRLMGAMVEHPDLQSLQVLLLRSRDARSLYARFGFAAAPRPEELMARYPAR
jgi:GNAT superfamily N-acetyltransferase